MIKNAFARCLIARLAGCYYSAAILLLYAVKKFGYVANFVNYFVLMYLDNIGIVWYNKQVENQC